jgi:hypothetical protein
VTDDFESDDEDVVTPRSREEWALLVALHIQEKHGENGPLYIAEMVGQFAIDGNVKAIETYREVAKAYETLLIPRSAKH